MKFMKPGTHPEHEVSFLEVDFGNTRPEVVTNPRFVFQNHDPTRSQTKEVLRAILSLFSLEGEGK